MGNHTSAYRGVHFTNSRDYEYWVARVKRDGKYKSTYHPTELDAAHGYNKLLDILGIDAERNVLPADFVPSIKVEKCTPKTDWTVVIAETDRFISAWKDNPEDGYDETQMNYYTRKFRNYNNSHDDPEGERIHEALKAMRAAANPRAESYENSAQMHEDIRRMTEAIKQRADAGVPEEALDVPKPEPRTDNRRRGDKPYAKRMGWPRFLEDAREYVAVGSGDPRSVDIAAVNQRIAKCNRRIEDITCPVSERQQYQRLKQDLTELRKHCREELGDDVLNTNTGRVGTTPEALEEIVEINRMLVEDHKREVAVLRNRVRHLERILEMRGIPVSQ